MSRRTQKAKPGPAGVVAGLLLALVAAATAARVPDDDEGVAGADCVLLSIDVGTEGEDTLLELATDGSPAFLGSRLEPVDGVVLDLTGCVPGPELPGRTFATGLVSSLRLIQKSNGDAPVVAVAVQTRQPFKYAVRSSSDRVQARLQPVAGGQRSAQPATAAAGSPDSAPEPPERVRVLEPLSTAPDPPAAVPEAEAEEVSAVAAVATRVERWAEAWSEQRVDDYLSAYASIFSPPDGASRDAWEEQRRQRLTAPRFITVSLEGLEVRLLEPGMAAASFWQSYTSDRFSDRVYKTQTWIQEAGDWRILVEKVVTADPR